MSASDRAEVLRRLAARWDIVPAEVVALLGASRASVVVLCRLVRWRQLARWVFDEAIATFATKVAIVVFLPRDSHAPIAPCITPIIPEPFP